MSLTLRAFANDSGNVPMARIDIGQRLDPEMVAVMAKQKELAPEIGVMSDLTIPDVRAGYRKERAFWNEGGPVMATSEDLAFAGPHGPVPLRLHRPVETSDRLAVLVFFHGGGWIVGDLDTHDRIMRVLAAEAGVAVLGVDYRLSPENKFPVALEECCALLEHLADQAGGPAAEWRLDAARLAVGGDSAGANMSLACALHCRGARPGLVKAALLYYGGFGLRDSASRRKFGGEEDGLSAKDLAYYKDCLIRSPADLDDPRIDLLDNDLAGLPPLFIAPAELDPLLDDSLLLSEFAGAAGVQRELRLYDGVLHGFLHYGKSLTKARQALSEGAAWLRAELSLD